MPAKQKGSKKIKRSGTAHSKGKYAGYLARSTCVQCRAVFRSPKKRRTHLESGHKILVGINKNRQPKAASIFTSV